MRAEFAWSPFNGQYPQALPSSVRGRSRGHLLPQGEKAPVSSKGFRRGAAPVLKASPSGEAAARRRLMRAKPPAATRKTGNSARSALIRPRRLGHLPPMGKAFMPAAPSHPQPASSRLPSSGRRSWCGPRSRSSGRWPYKRHPQTGRCTA